MRVGYVIDASVAAKLYFAEEGSEQADEAVREAERIIAPDLLYVEMASIAAKTFRRAIISKAQAAFALESVMELPDETIASSVLAPRAFALAAEHGFSAYHGVYLAGAECRNVTLLTADMKLAKRASDADLSHLVHTLATTV